VTSEERTRLRDQLEVHEGFRAKPYRWSAGKLTIGFGRNLEDVGIDRDEATYLLQRDITRCLSDLSLFPWFHKMNAVRQRAVIDMRFQLGPTKFRGFKKMLEALTRGDFAAAADAALDSKWAILDSPARAKTVASQLRNGA
jgi:lysozyme